MDSLYEDERKARLGLDTEKLRSIHLQILHSCTTDDEVIYNLKMIQNKRNQDLNSFKALLKVIYSESCENLPFLIKLLNEIVAGKIYLEHERILIGNIVKNGYKDDIGKAYSIIKYIPVETFTTISDDDRNTFLFEQCKLALLLNFADEAEIILRRVRFVSLTDLYKENYFNYKILILISRHQFIGASKCYLELIELFPSRKSATIGCYFAMISSSKIEKRSLFEEKNEILQKYVHLSLLDERMRVNAKMFLGNGIIGFSKKNDIEKIISFYDQSGIQYLENLKYSIIEFNFFIIKKFFSTISLNQISLLCDLSLEDSISTITEMVNENYLEAKIDQLTSFVTFGKKGWNASVDRVYEKFKEIEHLIDTENIQKPSL